MSSNPKSGKNRISGLSYAFTKEGVELPVLDITHPLFLASIDEGNFQAICGHNAHEGRGMNKLPGFIKNWMRRMSNSENTYLSGMRTLVFKLGPKLTAGRKVEWWYRLGARQFSAMAVRLRLLKLCEFQAELLTPKLRNEPSKGLCFINIAGGSATDSINTLILICRKNPDLLKGRKIEINVLDCDAFGPDFAEKSIEALREPGGCFQNLDLSFRHIPYDWNDPSLSGLFSQRKDWIQICASEGGLFEYASGDVIVKNLKALYELSSAGMEMTGTLFFDRETVNTAILYGMEIMGVAVRFLGLNGLKNLLKQTGWELNQSVDIGDVYSVFTLRKK